MLCLVSIIKAQAMASEVSKMSFCYEEWQPYAYVDEKKQHVGFSVNDLKQKLAAANLPYLFTELPFPRCKQAVISGQIDFILHIDAADDLNMISQPIALWQLTFAVNDNSTMNFEDIVNTKGLKVLIARSYVYPEELEEKLVSMAAKVIKVSYYTGEKTALNRFFQRLAVGQGDLMVVDKLWAQQVARQYQLPIKVLEPVIISVPQYIGYQSHNTKLAHLLEQTLK